MVGELVETYRGVKIYAGSPAGNYYTDPMGPWGLPGYGSLEAIRSSIDGILGLPPVPTIEEIFSPVVAAAEASVTAAVAPATNAVSLIDEELAARSREYFKTVQHAASVVPSDALWNAQTYQQALSGDIEQFKSDVKLEAGMQTGMLTSQIGVVNKEIETLGPATAAGILAITAGVAGAAAGAGAGGAAAATAATGAASTAAGAAAGAAAAGAGMSITDLLTRAITSPIVAAAVISQFGLGGWMLDLMLSPVISALTPAGAVGPATAADAMARAQTAMRSAASSLVGMTVMSEAMAPLKSMGLGYMAAMMGDAAGFRPVISAIVSPYILGSLTVPLMYSVMSQAQPYALSERDLLELYDREEIPIEQLVDGMKLHGFSETVARERAKLTLTALRPGQLRLLAQAGFYDHDIFEDSMKREGLEPDQRAQLHKAYALLSTEEVFTAATGIVRRLVREGFRPREDVKGLLSQLGAGEQEITKQERISDLEYEYDWKLDKRDLVKDRFVKGEISRTKAISELAEIMPAGDRIPALVDRWELKVKVEKVPAPPAPVLPSRAELEIWLKRGIIALEEWAEGMVALRIRSKDIERFREDIEYEIEEAARKAAEAAPPEKPKPVPLPTKSELRMWIKKELIDWEDWATYMKLLGYEDPEIALYRADIEREIAEAGAKRVKPPK